MTADVRFSPNFSPNTDPPHLFTVRVVQHCSAILATAEPTLYAYRALSKNGVNFMAYYMCCVKCSPILRMLSLALTRRVVTD